MKSPTNPYIGPRAFLESEHLYGRDRELADLMDLLLAERIVLLYSPSGAGKSSLVQAGLIPAMRARGFQDRKVIRVNAAPPKGSAGNRYVMSVMASLQLEGRPKDLEKLTLKQYLDAEPNGELLIFDQFEEVLTTDPVNIEAKRQFFEQIGEVLRARGRWALFGMREDFLAALDPYLNYVPTRLSNTFRLGLLTVESSKEAIRGPAASVGVKFLDEAVNKIADDLRKVNVTQPDGSVGVEPGHFIEPVQLQVVCNRIWRDLPEGAQEIGLENIQFKGDTANTEASGRRDSFSEVDRALADFYSDTVKETAIIPEAIGKKITERDLRDWFEQHLITHQGIRTQVLQSEGLGEQITRDLIAAHIVRSETRSNRDFLELAHDRLIQPVLASNKEWRDANLSPFQVEAEKWSGSNESSRLLRGQALQQAEAWAKKNVLNATELKFLKASQRARRALWLGRIVTAVMGMLLVAAVVFAWKFNREQKSYVNVLTAGLDATSYMVFQIDHELSLVPNTTEIRKELLRKAIELNTKLGASGESNRAVEITKWWTQDWQGKLAELEENREAAEAHYQQAKKIADELVNRYGDDNADRLQWLSNEALGDFNKKYGDYYASLKDDAKARVRFDDASASFQKALEIALKLESRDPKNRELHLELYLLYKDLGDTVAESTKSHEFYVQALSESTKLTQENPNDDSAQAFLWQSLTDLADWNRDEGNDSHNNHDEEQARAQWKQASALYQQALPVAQKLLQMPLSGGDTSQEARNLENRQLIWANYMALGDVEQDVHEKRKWYEKARASAEEMHKDVQESAARKLHTEHADRADNETQAKKDLDQTLKALRELDSGAVK